LVAGFGRALELRVVGYQFPVPQLSEEQRRLDTRAWDANWLVISGEVRADQNLSWSFQDSCLTTWEAGELVDWLGQVGTGAAVLATDVVPHQRPSRRADTGISAEGNSGDWPSELSDRGWLTFTEPNLSFAVMGYGRHVDLRVRLSAESGPPPVDPTKGMGWYELPLDVSVAECRAASADLQTELKAFPAR